ncbi:MAG: tRNA 2-thiocytidine biosynthesis protein TtcA [Bacteroidales bacterium]|nr:tRNA 2-thiocytidine biosynthesis protein TtcA [Bacteroidales bacterium]
MRAKQHQNLLKRVGRTIQKQELILENDKILVALSGGKDSMVLLEALADRKKRLPFSFELFAVHVYIDNIGYNIDTEYLNAFCNSAGVKFILKKFPLEVQKNTKKSTCFLCSWNRRKMIFSLSKQLGCNKIAFGHQMDDAIETLFMNMIYHGSISSIPYKLSMFDGRIELIRPLLEITDKELKEYSEWRDYKNEIRSCPFENTERLKMKEAIENFTGDSLKMKKNIFRSMNNLFQDYLPKFSK